MRHSSDRRDFDRLVGNSESSQHRFPDRGGQLRWVVCGNEAQADRRCSKRNDGQGTAIVRNGRSRKHPHPDVTVSFLSLQVREERKDRVRVSGARGRSPTTSYKVSASYRDGFWAQGVLTIFGRNAVAKARRSGGVILKRVRKAGYHLERSSVECVGAGACLPGLLEKPIEAKLLETVLRVTVADPRRERSEDHTSELQL